MEPTEVWPKLEMIYHLSPRDLNANEAMEDLHRECRRALEQMAGTDLRVTLSRYVRDVMLSEESIASGNGWQDVLAFLDWIEGGAE